jgi:hypothetical protein
MGQAGALLRPRRHPFFSWPQRKVHRSYAATAKGRANLCQNARPLSLFLFPDDGVLGSSSFLPFLFLLAAGRQRRRARFRPFLFLRFRSKRASSFTFPATACGRSVLPPSLCLLAGGSQRGQASFQPFCFLPKTARLLLAQNRKKGRNRTPKFVISTFLPGI